MNLFKELKSNTVIAREERPRQPHDSTIIHNRISVIAKEGRRVTKLQDSRLVTRSDPKGSE